MEDITLAYFPVRGRCEPVFLMLLDAKLVFTTRVVSLKEWTDWRGNGNTSPPGYPSSSLPVLSFTHAKSGEAITLGETNAILLYLDQLLRSPGLTSVSGEDAEPNIKPLGNIDLAIDAARRSAVLEMCMFYLNRVFQTTRQKEWIVGEARSILGKGITVRFLQGLEYHLKLTPDLLSTPDDVLSGPTSAAFVALAFTYDIFPSLTKNFPRCRELYLRVRARPAISNFYLQEEEHRLKMPWTITEYGRSEYIKSVVDTHEESDRALFEDLL